MPKKRPRQSKLYVLPASGGWTVKIGDSSARPDVYATKAEAMEVAKRKLQQDGGELMVQGRNGQWSESFTIGRESMWRLNEIEGVRAPADSRMIFREFDKRDLSPKQRRKEIVQRFSKRG